MKTLPSSLLNFATDNRHSMFDRSDLEKIPSELLWFWEPGITYSGLYCVSYPQSAFTYPDSEECIRVTRVPKPQDDNGLGFWLQAERQDHWPERRPYFARYVTQAQFERITEDRFNQMVAEQTVDLIAPLQQPLHAPSGFIGAMLMYSMKTDFIVSLFAEYEDEFVHFYWHTTS